MLDMECPINCQSIVINRLQTLLCWKKIMLTKIAPTTKEHNMYETITREGFATIPDVTWDDIGALSDIRDELQMAILVRLVETTLVTKYYS